MICPACGSTEGVVEQTQEDQTPFACLDCDEQIEEATRWAFTFGIGTNLRNNYVVVEAATEREAIHQFLAGRVDANQNPHWWAFVYPFDDTFAKQIRDYVLTPVPIDTPVTGANY